MASLHHLSSDLQWFHQFPEQRVVNYPLFGGIFVAAAEKKEWWSSHPLEEWQYLPRRDWRGKSWSTFSSRCSWKASLRIGRLSTKQPNETNCCNSSLKDNLTPMADKNLSTRKLKYNRTTWLSHGRRECFHRFLLSPLWCRSPWEATECGPQIWIIGWKFWWPICRRIEMVMMVMVMNMMNMMNMINMINMINMMMTFVRQCTPPSTPTPVRGQCPSCVLIWSHIFRFGPHLFGFYIITGGIMATC